MRIGVVAPEFPPETGGVQTYAWQSVREFAALGHEVTVFTQPHLGGEVWLEGAQVEPVLHLRRRRDRHILRHRPDVWHALSAPCAWLALDTATPVFVTVHGNDFLHAYHAFARLDLPWGDRLDRRVGDALTRRLMARALPRAHHIFANSRYTEGKFLERHPACAGKTSVASCGIAPQDFAPHEPPHDGPPRFITISRLSERRKNIPAVLEALAQLRPDHDFHYTIVGDGELRPELERHAVALGLAERVTFTGLVSPGEKRDLLCRSDLFILASTAGTETFEGFGLVYLEANACGTPTLAARLGGAVEAVEEGVSGYFAESPTVAGLAAALRRFLAGEMRFDAEGCTAFARRFSWRAVAEHCVRHFAAALG